MAQSDRKELTPEQMNALIAPARMEILEAIQVHGQQTAADLAGRLGREPDRLYYHLKKLVGAGVLVEEGAREVAAPGRNGTVYAVAAKAGFGMELDPGSRAAREVWARGARTLLRQAAREVDRALESGEVRARGRRPNLALSRSKAWLTDADLAVLNRHIVAIEDLLRKRSARRAGRLHALTITLAPLEDSRKR